MGNMQDFMANGPWKKELKASLHQSVDEKAFFDQYQANPELWQKVFSYFANTDLVEIEVGKYPIDGDQAFAIISDYTTKEHEDAKWESHKNYIDLQYVVSGNELMGLTSLDKAQDATEYNSEKDLIFYGDSEGDYYKANPGVFFLFFPADVHRPSMKDGDPMQVRKLVVKIRVSE